MNHSNDTDMEKSGVITWIFTSFLIAMPGAVVTQSATALSTSVTTDAQTELAPNVIGGKLNVSKKRRKVKVKSQRIERSDAELSQILNETTEVLAGTIHTEDVDLHSLLHATSGHTVKPMEKWL